MFWQVYIILPFFTYALVCVNGLTPRSSSKSLLKKKSSEFPLWRDKSSKNKVSSKPRQPLALKSSSKPNFVAEKSNDSNNRSALKLNLLSACLSLSYASIIVDMISLPAGLLLIKQELGGSFTFSKMMFAATMATMAGKIVLGPPTDYFGGEMTMKVSMAGMTILLLLCSITTKIDQLAPLWIGINFIYATAWGACGKVVRERYFQSEWGMQLGFISGASRIASVLAALAFGRLLHTGSLFGFTSTKSTGLWRQIFKVTALFQALVLLTYLLVDRFFISTRDGTSNSKSGTQAKDPRAVKSTKPASIYLAHRLAILGGQLYSLPVSVLRSTQNVGRAGRDTINSILRVVQSLLLQLLFWKRNPVGSVGKNGAYSATRSDNRLGTRKVSTVSTTASRTSSGSASALVAEEDESVAQVLSRVCKYPSFWLMLIGKASLLMVGQFISFIPSYLGTEPSFLCSPAEAANISSFFALGSFISSVFGTLVYASLRQRIQIKLVTLCNIVATCVPVLLSVSQWARLSTRLAAPLLAIWGMCWALPFYVPPGLFVLSLSRPHAALLTNIYDAVGFMLGAFFSYFAVRSAETAEWKGSLLSLAAVTGITTLCMHVAMHIMPKRPVVVTNKSTRRQL